ncbi:MAG TPA: HD domain-containing protein [Archaeoglobaceae archaeon]|nr:HD domain-containing protein [Archaeoglobaceae archaeon]
MVSHNNGHTERVRCLAILIAQKEGADIEVVKKAAELHDIARDSPNHAIAGAKVAREHLRKEGYNEDFIERVVHCIESHSFSSGVKPETLEAKILSDADKLDAIGAIGVARAFLYSGEQGRTIEETLKHFEEKLLNLRKFIETEYARKIAEERHQFLVDFYKRIRSELEL